MRIGIGVLGWILIVSCGGGRKHVADQPEPKMSEQQAVDAAVEQFVGIGRAIMNAKSDCDAMAENVRRWLFTNGDRRKQVNAVLANVKSEELKQRYRDGLGERLDVVMGMKAGLDGCREHAGVQAAWREMDR